MPSKKLIGIKMKTNTIDKTKDPISLCKIVFTNVLRMLQSKTLESWFNFVMLFKIEIYILFSTKQGAFNLHILNHVQ